MRLDQVVHGVPWLYEWKLRALAHIKAALYRLLRLNDKVAQQRKMIESRNRELIAKHVTGKSVLEIGCGTGSLLASLATRGCRCVGIDVSPEMITAARKNNPGPDYQIMDSAQLRFPDGSFDVVLFNYVLHHIRDLNKTIAEAKRVGETIIFYECCAWKKQPFKTISRLYWKVTDGGYEYLTFDEWKQRFKLVVVDEIEGSGLVRYGMGVLTRARA
jgi:ubiquinone/menaquinone biosynthesis C-methylase UbiE